MFNSLHYKLTTTSMTEQTLNAVVSYDVYFDIKKGIAYEVELKMPGPGTGADLEIIWHGKIYNDFNEKRFEYDFLKRIYYQTKQTIQVESALFKLAEDLTKFMSSSQVEPVSELSRENGEKFPGYKLNTLTIWFDPQKFIPIKRINLDRGNVITDEFTYLEINGALPDSLFQLPKPPEAIADFNLYPEAPSLPRFEVVPDRNSPQSGVYVETLLEQIKRHIIENQWEYGPFSTIKLPWLTEMPVTIYRAVSSAQVPPLVVVFDVPQQGFSYFTVAYDFLGYVVTGFTQTGYGLTDYERLPITASVTLRDFIPLYAGPSIEKEFVVSNFIKSVQSNDFFINAFGMGGKTFDLTLKNFSFNDNEGYLILDVYGKEYWDNANLEAMFDYVITGQMADAHTTPLMIYTLNTIKRLGIYSMVTMPTYQQLS